MPAQSSIDCIEKPQSKHLLTLATACLVQQPQTDSRPAFSETFSAHWAYIIVRTAGNIIILGVRQ
jgi:hypothetical protein